MIGPAAGRFRHRVEFRRRTSAATSAGGRTFTYTTYARRKVEVKPITARDFWNADSARAEITHTVSMRPLSGITPEDRIVWGARTFDIIGQARDIEERRKLMVLTVKERT